ncbi:MAG: GTP 3',8-cyclase MoaA [Nitrososphaerota archaeon]|jgi:cyclic pyranopterin phosphate synthase|uniref:GTP 3',8-cyclase MoaA n=1 Tax=Candidatus Bathycorpusculum sp. TaxID=2994959 RepID=UPI002826DAF3|nr:GTP 3',8-cyclase MoaA [Candidatus Termitimicrobium sp.]MCL2431529.1 GTP 3',8-cyclase MoaA [Candidatus Termitimicrobium sp.]MDR0493585.1 GTP 3',8-cyclase MoaA [Nitrososphaerota archaeon]
MQFNGNAFEADRLKPIDSLNRIPQKLRISITDRCNMHCVYCMPKEGLQLYPKNQILSYEEIQRLAAIFAGLGIKKIRLTGGEPLVRPEIEKLVCALSSIDGIKTISMTTNGLLLNKKAAQLKIAGLHGINVSLDTLKPDRFKSITRIDGLSQILLSLQTARDEGFEIKINTVIIRGQNDDEIVDFAKFAIATGYPVRFIEFMPLDGSHIWNPSLVVTKEEMIQRISQSGLELLPLNNNLSDPARLYAIKDNRATIGFIPSISEPFCGACDRLRLTSDGKFLTCIFERPKNDVKKLIRAGKSDTEIADYLMACYQKKPPGLISLLEHNTLRSGLNLMNTIGG